MGRKRRRDQAAMFPEASSDEAAQQGDATEEAPPVTVQFPITPATFGCARIAEHLGLLTCRDIKMTGNFTITRGQAISLGSALIKMGNSMPRDDAEEVQVEEGGDDAGLVVAQKKLYVPGQS